ncbi:MAG TPA: hypothetical protein VG722_07915, partial [Tepidisphaeraceae bacterium]|nr:hypothetical protein [Tepidisphaeraceae bacterium]
MSGQAQLFLDDSGIQEMTNLQRTMHTPQKQGAVITPDTADGETIIQTRSAPTWNPTLNEYQLVYISNAGGQWHPLLATSTDGIHWTKPNLGRPAGDAPNQVVVNDPTGQWTDAENVVYNPNDPNPATRYAALLGDVNRIPGVSADGYNFTPIQITPLTSGDESQLTYDSVHNQYIASLKTFSTWGRSIGVSTSSNLTNWTSVQTVFATDLTDQQDARQVIEQRISDPNKMPLAFVDPEPPAGYVPASGTLSTWACDVYNMSIFPYGNGYIAMPAIFYRTGLDADGNNTDGFQNIQLAFSTNLQNWERLGDRQPFITSSDINNGLLGVYDRTEILPPSAPVVVGNQLYFYYTGIKWRDCPYAYNADGSPRPQSEWTSQELADYNEGAGAVCLATLRLDGFFSLDAADTAGTVVTDPVQFGDDRLFLNLSAASDGWAKVQVVNAAGQPIPGYTFNDAVPVTGDNVRIPVSWKSASLDQLAGQTVYFQIMFQDASLYSYQAIAIPDPVTVNYGANQNLGDLTLDLGGHTVHDGRNSSGANVSASLTLSSLSVTGGGSDTLDITLPGNTTTVTGALHIDQSTKLIKTGPGLLIAGSLDVQGTLDLTNGDMAVDYTGDSPLQAV